MQKKKPNLKMSFKNKPAWLSPNQKKLQEFKKQINQPLASTVYDELFSQIFQKKHMKKIGQGSQGVVYKVVDRDLKIFAVKETEIELTSVRELHYMRQIHSRKVVQLHDFRRRGDRLYMLIEYMNGGTLQDILSGQRTIPEGYLSLFVFQILQGLEVLHRELKILHRDVKPANLLFNMHGHLKLADFGVSAQVVRTLDQKSTYVGTQKYMAPERIQGPKHDSKSDIWALGVIVFECFYGRHPVSFENQLDLIAKMEKFAMPKDAPEGLRHFVASCLRFTPAERLSATQLLAHEWLSGARKLSREGRLESQCRQYLLDFWKQKKSV